MHPSTAAIRPRPPRSSVSPAAWVGVGLLGATLVWGGAWAWERAQSGPEPLVADSTAMTTLAAPEPGAKKPLPVADGETAQLPASTPDDAANDAAADAQTSAAPAQRAPAGRKPAPLAGHASAQAGKSQAAPTQQGREERTLPTTPVVSVCNNCGVVEAVETVRHDGQASGLGAVAGGVVGGALGNQVGRGSGKTAMTVLGAVGGGFAGHTIEKKVRAETVYRVKVRMEDGTLRSVTHAKSVPVGSKVTLNGQTLKVTGSGASATTATARNDRA